MSVVIGTEVPGETIVRHPGGLRWTWGDSLALVGLASIGYGSWTIVAWLADGPPTASRFQNRDEASWYVAHGLEIVVVAVSLMVGGVVLRRCVRQRQVTFDAQFCLAGAFTMWMDPTQNFFMPVHAYSVNFVNLRSWCGHLPGVVNPDCGRKAEPVVMQAFMYTFLILAVAMVLNALMATYQARRPSSSTRRLVTVTLLGAVVIELAFEPVMVALNVWAYPASPSWMSLVGSHHRLPWPEVVTGVLLWMAVALVRYLKDDRGRTVVDRVPASWSTSRRLVYRQCALCGVLFVAVGVNIAGTVVPAFYSSPFPPLPASVINGMCDSPGVEGTRYGPCPGSPGFRLPIRSLPGDAWTDPPGLTVSSRGAPGR